MIVEHYYLVPAFSRNLNLVKYLVDCGLDINKAKNDGWTPLFYASMNGHENIVKYLVGLGADINKQNNNSY